jgi:histidinol-phosphate aminotransferase
VTDSQWDYQSLFRNGIRATRPYSPGKPIDEVKRELGMSHVIKLASNENPEGPLPEVLEAINVAALGLNRYPDASSYDLTRKLADQLDVSNEEIFLGNGSNEIVNMLIRSLISPGENVVFSDHSFIAYALICQVHFECGRVVPLTKDYRHDLTAMAATVDKQTKLAIVCNPNNPTGTYNTIEELEAFLAAVPSSVVVAIDEAYYEYVTASDYPQTLQLREKYPNLVILRTFSKIHSLAGLRVGYAIGHPGFIGELHKTREPFNVNMIAQAAACACLDNWHEVAGRAQRNTDQKEWLVKKLEEMGLATVPSQTNFVFLNVPVAAGEVANKLLKKGVIVRPMAAFGLGDGAMRISVGLPKENQLCLEALKEILNP